MLASVLAAYFAVGGQPLPTFQPEITYDANALSARQVMADLSRLSGQKLECVNDILAEHLILHFEGAPMQDVLDKVAYVTFGKWERAENVLRLRRDPAQVAANEAEAYARSVAIMKRGFDIIRKNLASVPSFDEAAARKLANYYNTYKKTESTGIAPGLSDFLYQSTPLNRAIDKALLCFTPQYLASLPNGRRVVFSDNPTAAQRPFPDGIAEALANLSTEQSAWIEANQAGPKEPGFVANHHLTGALSTIVIPRISHALLILTRREAERSLSAQLTLYDESGAALANVADTIDAGIYPVDITKPIQPPVAVEEASEAIPLPTQVLQAARLFSYDDKAATPADRAAVVPLMENPTRVDPASLVCGPCFIAMARVHHENLAALVDDAFITSSWSDISSKGFNPTRFRKNDLAESNAISHKDGSWFTIRPHNLQIHIDTQGDRESLEAAAKELIENGRVSLESAAAYAFHSKDQSAENLYRMYLKAIDPVATSQIIWNEWGPLRFYGSLHPAQRSTANPQPLASLDQSQEEIASEMIYGSPQLNKRAKPEDIRNGLPQSSKPTGSPEQQMMQERFSPIHEPTQQLPNGLPGDGTLKISTTPETATMLALVDQTGGAVIYTMNVEGLARMINEGLHAAPGSEIRRVINMRPGNQHKVLIEFSLTNDLYRSFDLTDWNVDRQTYTSVNDLPNDWRDAVLKAIDADAKRKYTVTITSGNGAPAKP